MTEGSGQVFSALELGPGCLVLGIGTGSLHVWKVPMSLLRNVEELLAFPVDVGTNCATPGTGDTRLIANLLLLKVHLAHHIDETHTGQL